MSNKKNINKTSMTTLFGAAFLMATSAIGPGFLTQTSVFTEQFGADFAFVILISLVLAAGVQLNVWRIICVSGLRGQDIANKLLPGLGYFIAFLVSAGGIAFNIGNVGGAALGVEALVGLPRTYGYVVCGLMAILIFISRHASNIIDRLVQVLGAVMVIVILIIAVKSQPPYGEALKHTFMPANNIKDLFFPIITLLGGTVGGYITFAGAHRLIDAGVTGKDKLGDITQSSVMGIGVAALMRIFLFLAALGVVSAGMTLGKDNPAAEVFRLVGGNIGMRFFGLVMWAAAISSVIGAAYTSVSFLKTLFKAVDKYEKYFIIGFIAVSTLVMSIIGQPTAVLVVVGSLNGLILPITLAIILFASRRKDIVGDYHHPTWLIVFGVIIVIVSAVLGISSLGNLKALFA